MVSPYVFASALYGPISGIEVKDMKQPYIRIVSLWHILLVVDAFSGYCCLCHILLRTTVSCYVKGSDAYLKTGMGDRYGVPFPEL